MPRTVAEEGREWKGAELDRGRNGADLESRWNSEVTQ